MHIGKLLQQLREFVDTLKSNDFDATFYRETYPDVANAKVNVLWHYIRHGWKEGRNPSGLFSTNDYLSANPDIAQAQVNPLWHYLRYGRKEGRPLAPKQPKYVTDQRSREANFIKLLDCIEDQGGGNVNYLFLFPLFSKGGAELVGKNFMRYLLKKDPSSSILVITTDRDVPDLKFEYERIVWINLSVDLAITNWEDRKVLVYDMIAALKPKLIHIINSSVAWQVLVERKNCVTIQTRVFANIFCNQLNEDGSKTGYANLYLPETYESLTALFSDNKSFFKDLDFVSNLDANKTLTLYTPFPEIAAPEKFYTSHVVKKDKLACLWAGRLDWQKNYHLAFEIARQTQFIDLDMYGSSVLDELPYIPEIKNLFYKGPFSSLETIPSIQDYDALIFTTRYEGLPNILIEAGRLGIPVIAPNVGGIGDLINNETGFLLTPAATVHDYQKALNQIIEEPMEALLRSKNLFRLISERHSWETFSNELNLLGKYGGE